MKPWFAEAFEWDEGNERELAMHAIVPEEVEDLFNRSPEWVPNKRRRAGDWKMVGYTSAGRAIAVVVSWHEERRLLRPVTGWDATPGETTKYLGDQP